MIEAGVRLFEAPSDETTGFLGEFGGRQILVFVIFQKPDAVKPHIGAKKRKTLEDAVGVLDREDDDGAMEIISYLEGTGVEGKNPGIWEVFVARTFGSDADVAELIDF